MNFKELFEGVEPKMPGAPSGIQIMTPQQFVTKAGDMPDEESEEGMTEEQLDEINWKKAAATGAMALGAMGALGSAGSAHARVSLGADGQMSPSAAQQMAQQGFQASAEKSGGQMPNQNVDTAEKVERSDTGIVVHHGGKEYKGMLVPKDGPTPRGAKMIKIQQSQMGERGIGNYTTYLLPNGTAYIYKLASQSANEGVAEGKDEKIAQLKQDYKTAMHWSENARSPQEREEYRRKALKIKNHLEKQYKQGVAEGSEPDAYGNTGEKHECGSCDGTGIVSYDELAKAAEYDDVCPECGGKGWVRDKESLKKKGVAESEDHLARIRKLSGLEEATKLPASSREFGGDEFQDYMKRIVGTPDTDKAGNVKVDKKGNEKYVSGKTKTDRYKMPYIHRSSVVEYLGPDGATYDEDAVKKTLSQRPKSLLKQNEKMKHSNGEFEQFFNVGFAALTGIALDEQTNKLIIVNTCPGAGSCKIDCFAMKGGKIQFKNAWQSDGRILTYLLNDPDGFFNQLSSEISKEEQAGQKGDKKFPKGWQTTIRWHDAGDFFSPEYLDLALKMAAKHPDTKFYAYTKMAGAALGQKPPNFIINWSEGAHTSQEKQVKASDANLDKTKNSRIVPDDLFQDLLVKDEKKNLVKGSEGQWQVQPDKLPELKNRLAKEYGLSANSILDYNQYMAKRKSIPAGMKYNVIVAPGEGDISANDPNIISTLLLKH